MRLRAGLLALLLAAAPVVAAQDPVTTARQLLANWHEDPARLDRARDTLESAVATAPTPDTLVELAHVWFTIGDFRARGEVERVAAYERGSDAARRAIAAAPESDQAHLWYAVNVGRLAELRGVLRAAALLSIIRTESDTVLKLNPMNVDGLILAAGLAAEVPGFMGGDRARAEMLFRRALELDPHRTGGRLELARLYVNTRRWAEAQRELQHILDERTPTDVPRWTVRDRPRARTLLTEIHERGRLTAPSEAP